MIEGERRLVVRDIATYRSEGLTFYNIVVVRLLRSIPHLRERSGYQKQNRNLMDCSVRWRGVEIPERWDRADSQSVIRLSNIAEAN
jgi:hypothetical protein